MVRQEKLAGRNIRVLRFASRENALWVGTRDGGLVRLDLASGALRRFAHDPADASSLADDRIYALHLDGEGRLWVGTDGGLDLLDAGGRRFTHFAPEPTGSE